MGGSGVAWGLIWAALEWAGGSSGPSLGWPGLIWVSLGAHLWLWGVIRVYLHVFPCKEEALQCLRCLGCLRRLQYFASQPPPQTKEKKKEEKETQRKQGAEGATATKR